VLVVSVETIPDGAVLLEREGGRVVLAHGEATGHAHAIRDAGATLSAHGDERYLDATEPVTIHHEEHAPIALPAGPYRIVIQREYVPADLPGASWRRVVD
jgi:hypothetical protein